MKIKQKEKKQGFTLIELMIVVSIMAIITPTIFRFYHEGLDRRSRDLNQTALTLHQVRVVFSALEKDLSQAFRLPQVLAAIKRDENTLLIETVKPEQRRALLAKPGDLARETPQSCFIVYRLEKAGLTRTVYDSPKAEQDQPLSQVLMTGLRDLTFTLHGPDQEKPLWIKIKIVPEYVDPSIRTIGPFTRIMETADIR